VLIIISIIIIIIIIIIIAIIIIITGASNAGWVCKFREFRQIYGYMWETILVMAVVAIEQ